MPKIKAAFFCNSQDRLDLVYGDGRKGRVAEIAELYPVVINKDNFDEHADRLSDVETVFSTWGMLSLDDAMIDRLPKLKIVFYGAGSVKGFAPQLFKRGIRVMSAWGANAVPVAEFTLAQILLSCKGYWQNTAARKRRLPAYQGNGVFNETVALLGCGMIGKKVIELLKPFHLDVVVVDPFADEKMLAALGVRRVTLEEAFATAYVVSNHVPNLPQLEGMMRKEHFASMRDHATFINTGRGAQVDEAGLIEVFGERKDLTALLDVTFPEPPEEGSPLYELENIHLTSHIAGSINNECIRMADYCIEQFENWRDGKPVEFEVTADMIDKMA